MIGVVVLAHLGNLVAVEADVEVVVKDLSSAVGRDGVRFGLHGASVAFADDRLDFEAEAAGHHRLDYFCEIKVTRLAP